MNHQEVRGRLGEYLEGHMTLGQRALLDAHLDACEACAAELRALRATVHLLRELPTPEVPAHLAERVVARIQDGDGHARWWDGLANLWGAIDPARYLPPLAAAALTSAVVIVGVRDLGWQIPGTRVPEQPVLAQAQSAAEPERSAPTPAPSAAAERPPRVYTFSLSPGGPAAPETAGAEGTLRVDRSGPALQAPFGTRAAPEALETAPARSPEEDLELALMDPRAFLAHFRTLGAPEVQEAWLASVAAHAARRRSVAEVARRLREAAGPEGQALATRFEWAAQAVAYPGEQR